MIKRCPWKPPEAVTVIVDYCLVIFKACRLGHPNLEKNIDIYLLQNPLNCIYCSEMYLICIYTLRRR